MSSACHDGFIYFPCVWKEGLTKFDLHVNLKTPFILCVPENISSSQYKIIFAVYINLLRKLVDFNWFIIYLICRYLIDLLNITHFLGMFENM